MKGWIFFGLGVCLNCIRKYFWRIYHYHFGEEGCSQKRGDSSNFIFKMLQSPALPIEKHSWKVDSYGKELVLTNEYFRTYCGMMTIILIFD